MKKLLALWKATRGVKTGAGSFLAVLPMILISLGVIEPSQEAAATSAIGGLVALIGIIDRVVQKGKVAQ